MSELKLGFSLYGLWLLGLRPRTNNRWFHIGGRNRQNNTTREAYKKLWRDVMKVAKETEKLDSSRGENITSTSGNNQSLSQTTDQDHGHEMNRTTRRTKDRGNSQSKYLRTTSYKPRVYQNLDHQPSSSTSMRFRRRRSTHP